MPKPPWHDALDPNVVDLLHERFIEKVFGSSHTAKEKVRTKVLYTVSRQIEIDAGHRVPFHDSQCRFLHGHRWKIVAEVASNDLHTPVEYDPESGMVMDFGNIKRILMEQIHAKFDHRLILWEHDPLLLDADFSPDPKVPGGPSHLFNTLYHSIIQVPVIPTSEGLASYWASLVSPHIDTVRGCWLESLSVWETPNSVAKFYPHR